MELLENTSLNKHVIELIEGKLTTCSLIYGQGLVELEIFKANIKTHLKTRFIRPSKSSTKAPIFFHKKRIGCFCFDVDNRIPNNQIGKKPYPLFFIGKFLDRVSHAK